MVCEKEPDCPIDFEHDGLDLTHDGTDIFARGTTLGGDDGVAVAYAPGAAGRQKTFPIHPWK